MTTANEIITAALTRCGSYSPAEPLGGIDAANALETLNDMLDSWSTDQISVYADAESILTFVPGQYQYTIGNYASTNFFTGTLVSGSPVISGVTIPTDLKTRADLTVVGTGIATGATVVAIGATTVTMSANATATVATPQVFNYTVPGDFKLARPLRISKSFTRITTQSSGLDYPIEMVTQDRYISIGYKNIPAPWPILAWYNPTMPLGTLYFYQSPSTAGELHLFSDTILTNFTDLTTNVNLPQGYNRALKWCLARELCAVNRYTLTPLIERMAKESYDMIKALNATPVPVATYDSALMYGNRTDAGWILRGGF